MPVRRTHRIAALGIASALLFAGCGSDDEAQVEDAAVEVEDGAEEQETDDTTEAADETAPEEETAEPEAYQWNSGRVEKLDSVPDADWSEVTPSPAHLILAPGVSLRVTQTAQLDRLEPELASQVDFLADGGPILPSDGETFILATIESVDPRWPGEERTPTTEGELLVLGSPATGQWHLTLGSGERLQETYLLSVPSDPSPEDAVIEFVTSDIAQTISLVDGSRVDSAVEPIYRAGTTVTLEGDGAYSHEFESWASGTHEINGQVTGAVVSPYVGGWARPGQIFLGVDVDARDSGGVDDDITDLRLELADGTTVTPDNDFSDLQNRFAETAWFQIPADTEQLTLHVLPKGKAGTTEIDFESPVEVQLTIEGAPTADETDPGDGTSTTEGPGAGDESTATQEPTG